MEDTSSELSYVTDDQIDSPARDASVSHSTDGSNSPIPIADAGAETYTGRAPPSRQGSFSGPPFVSISVREHVRHQSRRYGSGGSDGAPIGLREAIANAISASTQSSRIPPTDRNHHPGATDRSPNPGVCVDKVHTIDTGIPATNSTAGPVPASNTSPDPSPSSVTPSVNTELPGASGPAPPLPEDPRRGSAPIPGPSIYNYVRTRGAFFIGNGTPVTIDENITVTLKVGANGRIDFFI